MTRSDMLMYQTCEKKLNLNHQCKTENGIWDDEEYRILDIIGDFEQLRIINQYSRVLVINPNQIKED